MQKDCRAGYNVKTKAWDQLDYGTTNNGISFSRNLPPGYANMEGTNERLVREDEARIV